MMPACPAADLELYCSLAVVVGVLAFSILVR